MGKWRGIETKLPAFEQNPTYQAKVDAAKEHYRKNNLDLRQMAESMASCQGYKEAQEDAISLVNIEIEALSQMLVDEMRAQGLEKLGLANGSTLSVEIQPYSSTENKEQMMNYFRRHKQLRQVMTVNWQTINAMNKDRLTEGKPAIPGTKTWAKISAKLRRGKDAASEAA